MDIFGALLTGMVIGAALWLAWGVVGLVVAGFHFLVWAPPSPPPGTQCPACVQLQELWDSMNWFEKGASFANFYVASFVCIASGCGELNLKF